MISKSLQKDIVEVLLRKSSDLLFSIADRVTWTKAGVLKVVKNPNTDIDDELPYGVSSFAEYIQGTLQTLFLVQVDIKSAELAPESGHYHCSFSVVKVTVPVEAKPPGDAWRDCEQIAASLGGDLTLGNFRGTVRVNQAGEKQRRSQFDIMSR
jgi:hypothetical protein